MTQVYLRDRSSGRIHVGVKQGRRLLTSEACNLDQAGVADWLDDLPLDSDESDYCDRCFPEPPPNLEAI